MHPISNFIMFVRYEENNYFFFLYENEKWVREFFWSMTHPLDTKNFYQIIAKRQNNAIIYYFLFECVLHVHQKIFRFYHSDCIQNFDLILWFKICNFRRCFGDKFHCNIYQFNAIVVFGSKHDSNKWPRVIRSLFLASKTFPRKWCYAVRSKKFYCRSLESLSRVPLMPKILQRNPLWSFGHLKILKIQAR